MLKKRPVNNAYLQTKLPITALISITHRLSGIIFFLASLACLFIFQLSLESPMGFDLVVDFFNNLYVKIILTGIFLLIALHISFGIRHMIAECGYFEEIRSGNISAYAFILIGFGIFALFGGMIW